MSVLVRGGRVLDPSQDLDRVCDLLIDDNGVIAEVGEGLSAEGAEEIDAVGLVVTPGLVDMHVHLREPGHEYRQYPETRPLAGRNSVHRSHHAG